MTLEINKMETKRKLSIKLTIVSLKRLQNYKSLARLMKEKPTQRGQIKSEMKEEIRTDITEMQRVRTDYYSYMMTIWTTQKKQIIPRNNNLLRLNQEDMNRPITSNKFKNF